MIDKFAPKLKERILAEKAAVASAKEQGESWKVTGGSYALPFIALTKDGALNMPEERTSQEDLIGFDVILYQELKSRLGRDSETPVVAVDFGGAHGLSFIRIANKLEKESAAVSTGRLVMVVTNLTDIEKVNTRELSKDEVDFFRLKKGLVSYITGDAAVLRKAILKTGTGSELPVRGNVDLIHEHFAVAHSNTPDIALPLLEQCMKETDSVMLLHSKGIHPRGTDQFPNERVDAFSRGSDSIINTSGLRAQDVSQYGKSSYTILKRPQSPDVAIDVPAIIH